MSRNAYRNFSQFRSEELMSRSGPLASPIEDMADEMFHQEVIEESDSMWDSYDSDDE